MTKQKCIVLIDGSNFYFKLKELKLHGLLNFDFSGFTEMLARDKIIVKSTYYIGKIRTDGSIKAEKMLADQQKLFAHLRKHKIRYSLGYLLKTNNKFREKGVDVNMAMVANCSKSRLLTKEDFLPSDRRGETLNG